MAFQFVHVETYSVKEGAGIAAEAGRKPSHSLHVDAPRPPVILLGVDPLEAFAEIERRHGAAREKVTLKGVTRERRLRSDQQVMVAAVASYPGKTDTVDTQTAEFKDWVMRSLKFFEAEHGPALSAVLHLDESHPHIHYITAPDLESGQRIQDIHRGLKAKSDAGGNRGIKRKTDRAYNTAMRDYQDAYQEEVGQYHAQARLGPGRQRMTREEWKNRKAEMEKVARGLRLAEAVEEGHRRLEAATADLADAQVQLHQRQEEFEAQAGSLWARVVSVLTLGRRTVATEKAEAIQDIKNKARKILGRLKDEKSALEASVRALSAQRDGSRADASESLRLAQEALKAADEAGKRADIAEKRLDLVRDLARKGDLRRVEQLLTAENVRGDPAPPGGSRPRSL